MPKSRDVKLPICQLIRIFKIDIRVPAKITSIMKKKLTLTIDESVSMKAKRLARREGTSISEMVENYLAEKTSEDQGWKPEKGSFTERLLGSVKLPADMQNEDYKTVKERALRKKYDL